MPCAPAGAPGGRPRTPGPEGPATARAPPPGTGDGARTLDPSPTPAGSAPSPAALGRWLGALEDRGLAPVDLLQTHDSKVNVIPHVSLKCLCVQAMERHATYLRRVVGRSPDWPPVHDRLQMPEEVAKFVRLHRREDIVF